MSATARILRYARRRAGLTQRALARRAGVPQPTIARIESGAVSPRVETMERLLAPCGMRLGVEPRAGSGVDRTAIRELLRLSPAERLAAAAADAPTIDDVLDRVEHRSGGRVGLRRAVADLAEDRAAG
jgi:transcriptional regulator with XRE-family HTH domain